jgi:hypothetical protein
VDLKPPTNPVARHAVLSGTIPDVTFPCERVPDRARGTTSPKRARENFQTKYGAETGILPVVVTLTTKIGDKSRDFIDRHLAALPGTSS